MQFRRISTRNIRAQAELEVQTYHWNLSFLKWRKRDESSDWKANACKVAVKKTVSLRSVILLAGG